MYFVNMARCNGSCLSKRQKERKRPKIVLVNSIGDFILDHAVAKICPSSVIDYRAIEADRAESVDQSSFSFQKPRFCFREELQLAF